MSYFVLWWEEGGGVTRVTAYLLLSVAAYVNSVRQMDGPVGGGSFALFLAPSSPLLCTTLYGHLTTNWVLCLIHERSCISVLPYIVAYISGNR